jgi:hypothetical protein
LTTAKAVFETYFSLDYFPLASYPDISLAFFTYLAHSLVALFRLSTFESPDIPWDRHRVIQELDMKEVLRLWSLRWSQVPAAAGLEESERNGGNSDVWTYTKDKLTSISAWFELKMASMSAADDERHNGRASEGSETLNGSLPVQHQMDVDFPTINFDPLDEAWMRDMLGGFDFSGATHV